MRRTRNRRPRRAGMTLIEIMIVVVIMSAIAAAIGMGVMSAKKDADTNLAKNDLHALAQIAEAYLLTRGGECPSIADLPESHLLRRSSHTEDPWGNAYQIACDDAEVNVWSAGPDGLAGSADEMALYPAKL